MSRPKPWVFVAPAAFMMAWGGNHFTPLLHLYEQVGHYAPWQANLLLGTYVFGLIPGLLVAASLSDQHGRRPVMLAGLVASAVGNLLLAVGLHSFLVLCLGRALAGVGVGVAMSVGSSWMKELSSPPFEHDAGVGAGARRPSLTLTVGFTLGALVTGVLAQWAPDPTRLPFLVHLGLCVVSIAGVVRAPESLSTQRRASGAWWRDLRVPAAGHRTFTTVVVPAAPWVFGAAGVAYAIMPAIVSSELGQWNTLYATVLTVLTLGSGALVQPSVWRIERATSGRALLVGLGLMTVGMVLAVVAAVIASPTFALAVAVILGVAYGITVVAGLTIVQRIAGPTDLAGLTGVYYALAYAGFLLPTLLAALLPWVGYGASLAVVAVVCGGCWLLVSGPSTPQ
ncbi:MFS transporter [Aestuariimicrobium soli]|uniref:MFS transporter n=1 Tax=Aestuariimicrobium soli TaxID=2035834 RepID=UPI003EC03A3F